MTVSIVSAVSDIPIVHWLWGLAPVKRRTQLFHRLFSEFPCITCNAWFEECRNENIGKNFLLLTGGNTATGRGQDFPICDLLDIHEALPIADTHGFFRGDLLTIHYRRVVLRAMVCCVIAGPTAGL